MGTNLSPGVDILEKDFSFYVANVPKSIFGMVGKTEKGEIGKPVLITSWESFQRHFGGYISDSYLPFAAKKALDKGAVLYISRVAHYTDITDPSTLTAQKASVTLKDRNSVSTPAVHTGSLSEPFVFEPDQPAVHTGTEVEPYNIETGVNDKLLLKVDGGSSQEVTLTAGALQTASDVANDINAQTTGITASVTSDGKLKLTTNSVGSSASLEIVDTANSAYSTLGLTVGVYNGADGTNILSIAIDGGEDQIITLTTGTRTAQQVADEINSVLEGGEATVESGKVKISTQSVGSSAELVINPATANNVLGFTAGIYTGSDGTAVDTLRVEAKSEGDWGNRISVKITANAKDPENLFDLNCYEDDKLVEVWRDLNLDPSDKHRYAVAVVSNSDYITLTDLHSSTPSPNNLPALTSEAVSLTGGTDGGAIVATDYIGDEATKSGFHSFDSVDEIRMLAAPGITDPDVIAAGLSYAENRQDIVYVFAAPLESTPQDAIDFRMGEGDWSHSAFNTSYGAMYFGWIKEPNPLVAGEYIYLPPEGYVMGACAETFNEGEVWFAPAGVQRGRIVSGLDLFYNPNQGDRDLLYYNGINPITIMSDTGMVIWGQKTLLLQPSALDRLNVRFLMIYLETAIKASSKFVVFEPNDRVLWRELERMHNPFLQDIKNRRGLYDFRVQIDEEINTPASIDRNELHERIFVKPTKTAEFISIAFVLTTTGAKFEEIF